jgi:hypothetical protein
MLRSLIHSMKKLIRDIAVELEQIPGQKGWPWHWSMVNGQDCNILVTISLELELKLTLLFLILESVGW